MHALHHHNCLSIHRCSADIVARCRTMFFVGVLGATLVPASLLAQDSPAAAGDCTEIDLAFSTANGPLTDEEISALHDARHLASLNQFERCISGVAGGGQGGGQGAGAGTGSIAASGLSGTQTAATAVAEPPPVDAEQAPPTQQTQEPVDAQGPGRAPIDIPPADNDGALAAQIRRAAETETDPDRRDRLWNEYRKIKGLPTK